MSLSELYLTCIGYIYAIAFISYCVQYPALASRSGIEPADHIFVRAFPRLHNIVDLGYVDVDSLVQLVNLIGIVISTVIASGLVQHGILFIAVSAIYRFLVVLGGTFYAFQWDILLVEAGFLTALCFAPWKTLKLKSVFKKVEGDNQVIEIESDSVVGAWPIRFLLFKLMFMSGVVKIQAECPTWQNLTALEYHFATQCLPGVLAWHAHQLPPFLLRLGVAATFVIEIPAAFLLLFPSVRVRKIGAWMQVFLQLLIIATGNYNFFNMLTMVLCLPCMISESNNFVTSNLRNWNIFQNAMCAVFLAYFCHEMFDVEYIQDSVDLGRQMIGLKLAMTKIECNDFIEMAIPIAVPATLFFAAITGMHAIIKNESTLSQLGSLIHMLVCIFCIVMTALPIFEMTPKMRQSTFYGIDLNSSSWRNIRRNSFTNGYGLFRKMTGVGNVNVESVGWAGLPPSIVARPEIIIEAVIEDVENGTSTESMNEVWHELKFRWKPGDSAQRPLQVAPHQPRFDWQLWFAALGSYQHNAWLISFIDKLLQGCPCVIDLLNEPEIMAGKKKVTRVRANLYQYDFTRLDTEWARRIPGVTFTDWGMMGFPNQYWTRKLIRQYLPPIDAGNPSLKEFLQNSGYEQPSVCVSAENRCLDVDLAARLPCHIAFSLGMKNAAWIVSFFILFCCWKMKQWQITKARNLHIDEPIEESYKKGNKLKTN